MVWCEVRGKLGGRDLAEQSLLAIDEFNQPLIIFP